jgi:hypothetical protein
MKMLDTFLLRILHCNIFIKDFKNYVSYKHEKGEIILRKVTETNYFSFCLCHKPDQAFSPACKKHEIKKNCLFYIKDWNIFHFWTLAFLFSLVAMPLVEILHLVFTQWNNISCQIYNFQSYMQNKQISPTYF